MKKQLFTSVQKMCYIFYENYTIITVIPEKELFLKFTKIIVLSVLTRKYYLNFDEIF